MAVDPKLVEAMIRHGELPPDYPQGSLEGGGPIQQGAKENPWLGAVKAVGTGALKGGISAAVGWPGDLEALVRHATGNEKAFGGPFMPFTSNDIYKKIAGVLHKPVDQTERSLESTAEGVMGSVSPTRKPLTIAQALLGGSMGLGGELGREAMKNSPVTGQLIGSGAPALFDLYRRGRVPNTVQAARAYTEAIGPEGLAEMAARRQAATELTGVPTLLNQGSPYPTTMDSIAADVARSREGKGVVNVVQAQRRAEEPLVRNFVEERTTKMSTDFEPNARAKLREVSDKLNKLSPATYDYHASQFAAKDPDAFALVLKSEFQDAAERSLGSASSGRMRENALTAFVNEVGGRAESEKRRLFETKIAVLAKAKGMSQEEANQVAKGASQYLDALLVLDAGRPAVHTLKDFGEFAGRSWPAQAMKASWVAPIRIMGQWMDRVVRAGSYKSFSDALTQPGGEKLFMDIAKFGPWTNAGTAAIRSLVQQSVMAGAAPEPAP